MQEQLEASRRYAAAGLSVVPIRPDGSKRPPLAWQPYQARAAEAAVLRRWFRGPFGVGVVCGAVSGGLEVLDFDAPALFRPWLVQAKAWLGDDRMRQLPVVRTPSGGYHVYYRCTEIEPNQRLAQASGEDGRPLVLIETRGEGGLVVAPPSPPGCHPLIKPYVLKRGDLTAIPELTPGERKLLHDAAHLLDRMPPAPKPRPGQPSPQAAPGTRPGDDFNQRGDGRALLERNGWTLASERGEEAFYRRPGKEDRGHCVTYNYKGSRLIHVFCANAAPLDLGRTYTLFDALAQLEHAGNFRATARALAAEGYGDRRVPGGVDASEGQAAEPKPRYRLSEGGNACRLLARFGDEFRYASACGWMAWREGRWIVEDGELPEVAKEILLDLYAEAAEAQAAIEQFEEEPPPDKKILQEARERAKQLMRHAVRSDRAAAIRGMAEMARTDPRVRVSIDQVDADPWLLTCRNGTLDLRTGRLREHRRQDLITRLAPVDYDPQALCPTWERFLRRIMDGNEDLIRFLHRVVGYALTGDAREQVLFMLYGTGENGKSTFLDAIMALLGDYARQTPPATLLAKRSDSSTNDLARLRGARLVSAVETGEGKRMAETLVKQLTGQDTISARFLYREYFEFKPTFKLFLATNHKPVIKGTDHAIWRRIRLIPFAVKIPPQERDPALPEKLRAELSGILRWAVEGCLAWQREGLGLPDAVKAATDDYRREMDVLAYFVAECCVRQANAKAGATALYKAYCKWCEDNGERVESQRWVGLRLRELGLDQAKRHGNKVWLGIGLLEPAANAEVMARYSSSGNGTAAAHASKNGGTARTAESLGAGSPSSLSSPEGIDLPDDGQEEVF